MIELIDPYPTWERKQREAEELAARSLRDQFAMAAMQGWIAAWKSSDDHPVAVGDEMGDVPGNAEAVADLSYRMADAMMARRDK